MPGNPDDLRREAEARVTLRFERQTAALAGWQRAERERDARLQTRAVADSIASQAKLEHDKESALAAHEKLWKEASDRLTPRPIPAPAFDLMGGPPVRNLVQDHDELRQRWTERRDRLAQDFDQRIAENKTARADVLERFGRANQAREQAHREERLDLAQRQRQSFERLVGKELDRADKWISREFNQRGRDDNARDL